MYDNRQAKFSPYMHLLPMSGVKRSKQLFFSSEKVMLQIKSSNSFVLTYTLDTKGWVKRSNSCFFFFSERSHEVEGN